MGGGTYIFHQYLLQQGYLVLNPDFRWSSGYGREWRVDVYNDLGNREVEDVVGGVKYLEKEGYIDLSAGRDI